MKINLVLLATMVLLPFLAKSQKEDSLKTEKVYIDYTFGHIQNRTFVGLKNDFDNQKIFFGNNIEASFDLKNPHFGIGTNMMVYKKIDAVFFETKKEFSVALATFTYSPFITENFLIRVGIGSTSKQDIASSYSARYLIDSIFPSGSIFFEGNAVLLGDDLDYNALAFIAKNGYFVGGYYTNNGVSGVCFGAIEQWMMLKIVLWNDRIEGRNMFSNAFQLDLTFPLVRKTPKLIYK